MVPVNAKLFVEKLNETCRQALMGAAGLCMSKTNYSVEIEHWLLKLLEIQDTDLDVILRHYDIDPARVRGDLTRALERLKTGSGGKPAFSTNLMDVLRGAWLLGSAEYGATQVRSGFLLAALLLDESLTFASEDASEQFTKISGATLRKDLPTLLELSKEAVDAPAGQPAGQPAQRTAAGKTQALDQYTIDLTARARDGHIDPVLGRDAEIRQVIDILTRRRQNNPILTGEAGVGKTAVAEGFALRIAAGDVPPSLNDVTIRSLDLGLLQAGAGVKGEFENRLKSVIEEVKGSPRPIILFIDEAHTMIGAGGQAGQGDAANLLKPALARGELRTIAATTWAEYKKYFEKDAALARRFQVVKVEEPNEAPAIQMMRGLVATLERHHNVRILDEAVVECVRLSNRYISGRQLPDKSVSLLDTACARVGIGQTATPPAIEDARRRIEQLDVEIKILEREDVTGGGHEQQIIELRESRAKAEEELRRFGDAVEHGARPDRANSAGARTTRIANRRCPSSRRSRGRGANTRVRRIRCRRTRGAARSGAGALHCRAA